MMLALLYFVAWICVSFDVDMVIIIRYPWWIPGYYCLLALMVSSVDSLDDVIMSSVDSFDDVIIVIIW